MQIIIKSVSIVGFKGNKENVKYDLGYRTLISGDNGQGKSTIGEAIVWAFTGCDIWGNEKAATKLVNDQKPKLTEVIVDFEMNGSPETIIRRKKGSTNEVYWNQEKVTTNDIARDIFKSKDVFLSIFNPYYFPGLAPKDCKSLLSGILKPVSQDEIFKELGDYLTSVLKNNGFRLPETFLSDKRQDLKEQEQNITYLEGVIAGAHPIEVPSAIEFDDSELEKLKKEYDNLLIPVDNVELSQLNVDKAIAEASLSSLALQPTTSTEALRVKKESLLSQYKNLDNKIKNIEKKIIICDNCGHEVDLTKDTVQMYKDEMAIILPQGQELKVKIEKIEAENKKISEKNNEIRTKKEREVHSKLAAIEEKRTRLLEEKKLMEEAVAEKKRFIRAKISELEIKQRESLQNRSEIDSATKHNEKLDKEIELSKKRIENSTNKIAEVKLAIDAAKQYNSIKLKKQSAMIDKYLDNVSLQFEKLTKEGELKEDFKILYEGKEFNKISASEKIKAGLEISNFISNMLDLHYPVFIDDSESITNIPNLETQMIMTKVTKLNGVYGVNDAVENFKKEHPAAIEVGSIFVEAFE